MFIMQTLDKFDLKINVIPDGLEKYMSCNLDNQLILINSFQLRSSSLDSLVNNVSNDFLLKC